MGRSQRSGSKTAGRCHLIMFLLVTAVSAGCPEEPGHHYHHRDRRGDDRDNGYSAHTVRVPASESRRLVFPVALAFRPLAVIWRANGLCVAVGSGGFLRERFAGDGMGFEAADFGEGSPGELDTSPSTSAQRSSCSTRRHDRRARGGRRRREVRRADMRAGAGPGNSLHISGATYTNLVGLSGGGASTTRSRTTR